MMYQNEIKKRWEGRAQIKETYVFPRMQTSQSPINQRKTSTEWTAPRNKKSQIAQSQTFIQLQNQKLTQI